jgi:hypothetical protein
MLASVFAFIVVVASFNVALEGPYMGTFFWTVLGLLLVVPRHWPLVETSGKGRPRTDSS